METFRLSDNIYDVVSACDGESNITDIIDIIYNYATTGTATPKTKDGKLFLIMHNKKLKALYDKSENGDGRTGAIIYRHNYESIKVLYNSLQDADDKTTLVMDILRFMFDNAMPAKVSFEFSLCLDDLTYIKKQSINGAKNGRNNGEKAAKKREKMDISGDDKTRVFIALWESITNMTFAEEKELDIITDFVAKHDVDEISATLKRLINSDFLRDGVQKNKFGAVWFIEHYDKITAGAYDTYKPPKQNKFNAMTDNTRQNQEYDDDERLFLNCGLN